MFSGVKNRRGHLKRSRKILSSEPILKLPDLNREIILLTDMMQEYEGMKHAVMYASKKMLPREQNYSVGERGVGYRLGCEQISQTPVWSTLHFGK